MNQFKISVLALAMTSIATTSAMAQSSKTNAWEGAYGQIGVGYGLIGEALFKASYSIDGCAESNTK